MPASGNELHLSTIYVLFNERKFTLKLVIPLPVISGCQDSLAR